MAWPPAVYQARPPPSRTLRYRVMQGDKPGDGLLAWSLVDGQYDASLTVVLDDTRPLFEWRSKGHLDAHGIAPQQLAEKRRRRGERTAEFEREAGRIAFSKAPAGATLAPGAQDRLSWMAQLAAIATADAKQMAPGRWIDLQVAMAGGSAGIWRFEVIDHDDGIHLHRSAQHAYDTELDVWLDPARDHWPRRLTQSYPPATLKLELRLVD